MPPLQMQNAFQHIVPAMFKQSLYAIEARL